MNVDTLQHGRNQPFYHVLPDTRDRPGAQLTYVAQVCARVCVWVLCGAWRVDRALHVHAHRMHTARTPHAHDAHAPSSPPTLLSPTRRRRTSSPTRRRSRCSTRWWTRCSKVSTWRGGASCRTRSCACSTRHRRPSDEGAAVLYSCSRRCELRTVTRFESHFPKRRSELRRIMDIWFCAVLKRALFCWRSSTPGHGSRINAAYWRL